MKSSCLQQIDPKRVPRHIAIIMDGNGRWARARGEDRSFGHEQGTESVRAVIQAATKLGVQSLTLYTFSEENWKRPEVEVQLLMQLLVTSLNNEIDELDEKGVQLKVIGDLELLPAEARQSLLDGIERTSSNDGLQLILALSYSGRSEILRAVNSLIEKGATQVDEVTFNAELALGALSIPDPDLLIRTGGEQRVSNFLLWQIAYTEFYFTPTFWPDFGEEQLYEAVYDYQQRERRYGRTGDQVKDDYR
ncbi:MAG: polyprenyl diphosphate synthase [Porphyromonas sp.]|nr:polyprenyl diphosphate synthase [Porphyromonas sp.]